MKFEDDHAPEAVLNVFDEWAREARLFVHDICAWRPCLAFRDSAREPWPPPPVALKGHTKFVCDWIRNVHALETDCFENIANAASTWLADRNHERLPSSELLHLELLIAQATLKQAAFPLLARLVAVSGSNDVRLIQRRYVDYALCVRDACMELIHNWPPVSKARWRYYNVVCPRYVTNTLITPLALALSEARRNGDLAVMAPKLEALNAGLGDYMQRFIEQPEGNTMIVEPSPLNDAVSGIVPYLGNVFESGMKSNVSPHFDACTVSPQSENDPPFRAKKAWGEYQQACEAHGVPDMTDREAHDFLTSAMQQSGERNDLPSFATWQRNVREYRRLTGKQKNKSRAGRAPLANSVVRSSQIEPNHLPTAIRPRRTDD